uniref:LRAT domain-containing protein n=1 Tax=Sinocyclocheilus anshuiensis TaxID=1608454 RepID=A0A671PJA4_9TELE
MNFITTAFPTLEKLLPYSEYQHWAVYVGEGHVIHLAPPCEYFTYLLSLTYVRATVKKGKLYVVVGNNDYRINNILDEKYEPRPIQEIVQDAHGLLGKELPYSVLTRHCEHFVTELRYGKPQSCQVQPLGPYHKNKNQEYSL